MKRGTLVWLVGLAGALTGLAEERRYSVPLFGAAADQRQGFVRLVNHSAATGTAQVYAIDDAGERRGPATLDFAPRQALHFNSNDLQQGNASKGIEGVGAPGAGDWRLEMASALDLEVLAYLRTTPGGFLASMHDLAPEADGAHRIAIFNPGSNANQRSRLRLVNAGATAATVTIRGVDDAGEAGAADISLALPGGEARTLDAKDMEDGAPGVFQGALGDGEGKWRLTVSADQPIQAMSLLDARETGLRANLSTAPRNAETSGGATTHRVPLFPPKSHATQQGFLRVANRSPEAGDVRITAVDDEGASRGPLTLTIAAGATAHINSTDLEDGNRAKGLSGGAGEGDGNWRLALRTSLDVDVLAYVRTRDGFLASMHDLAPAAASSSHRVAMFNPARNANQRSRLRLINDNDEDATVAIAGVDDRGATGAGAVRIVVPANAARDYSAADLESGANRSVQVFEESWDGGAIDPGRWDEYGQPRPRIVEALQGGSNVFDNNGDGNHGSGAVTARGIDLGSGAATIAADVYVDFSDPAGCWADAAIGLTRDAEARTSATGFGAQGIWLALKARGDACAGTPAEHRRRAWFFGGMLDADGNWERMTPYTVGGDDYVDAWHRLRIVVDASNRVSFHVDGTLLWQSTGTLDPALRSGRRLALGTHSSGRAGKAYIDNISVSATPRTIVAGALGAGRGKWRLTVESNRRIGVMGLLESPAGHLTNLSAGGAALPNQRPVVTIPADAEVAEGEVLNVAASASDPDGSIASWRWEQISGPAFDLHRTDAPRLVATAPFVENDETAVFRVAATDDRRGTTTATLRVRVNASALALVAVRTEVSIPAQVSNVRAADVVVASLESDSGRVRADQSATLLIGSDADGTVALSLANEDGGLMGEGSRPVGVGIDSTAVALVAVAAGYRIPDIDQAVVGRIMARDRYDELTQLLTGLMAVDKNYLDRLYDYGDAVALVKAVADAVRAAEQSSPAGFRRSPARPRALPSWPVHDTSSLARPQAETGPIAMRRKNDFYCVPALRWPCSPWMPHEPWNWFGDASGAEALFGGRVLEWVRFLVSPISLSPSEAFRLIDGYAEIVTELVGEAAHPPFLAVSKDSLHSFCLFDCANVHAAANPNFVNYAMELYDDGVYRDWFYTPRNLTVVDKLLNSGAAYRELLAGADRADAGVQLGPDIDLVRFQRYRFARAGDGPERDGRRMVNFMNAFHLVIAGLNVFTDLSEVGKAANQISEKSAAGIAPCVTKVVGDLGMDPEAGLNIYVDVNQAASDQMLAVLKDKGYDLLEALRGRECRSLAAEVALDAVVGIVARQVAKTLLDAAGTAAWVKLAFDASNETGPVLTSYLAPSAGRIDYHIGWAEDEAGVPYISTVSTSRPPRATFGYAQKDGFNVELDASDTVAGDSARLTFEWRVDGSNVGSGETITHDFRAAGAFAVDLTVTDGNGLSDRFGAQVAVTSGRAPVVTSLACAATVGKAFSMEAEYADADDDIVSVEWRSSASAAAADETTGADRNRVELTASGSTAWASVTVVDARGNRTSKTCAVAFPGLPSVERAIPAQWLVAGRSATLDLAGYFADDQALSYRASSSDANVLRASVAGSVLTLTPVSGGRATVTATARDPDGHEVAQAFAATVRVPPRATRAIPAQSLAVGSDATLDLSAYFADDQRLSYSARSSNANVLRASVTDSVLTLMPVTAGSATVTATARDPDGHEAAQTFAATVRAATGGGRAVGEKFRDCSECPLMVVVPAGSFMMGAPESEVGSSSDERPVHAVTIGAPFAVGVYEVTFAEWDACVADGGCRDDDGYFPVGDDQGWGRGNRPVISLNLWNVKQYVSWLSGKTRESYRLLSESEWEYAARSGTRTTYSWGDAIGSNRANCFGLECGGRWDDWTAPVGSFGANAWGLYDMHGNVEELVEDCINFTYVGAPSDGSAWRTGNCELALTRGGSFRSSPLGLRAANRGIGHGVYQFDTGFRVARTLTP